MALKCALFWGCTFKGWHTGGVYLGIDVLERFYRHVNSKIGNSAITEFDWRVFEAFTSHLQ